MTTPNNGGAAKGEECLLCGRTEDDADICIVSGICDECDDECNDDPSWGAHEDGY